VIDKINALNVEFSSGVGVPTHIAPKGTLYINKTAATSAERLYINTNNSASWESVGSGGGGGGSPFTGDSGSGGVEGLVPAPAAYDC
jgi:hypothetical protein